MKQIILIKQSDSMQLAHLYEHIFCAQVDSLFYKNGLFPHLDYLLSGHTYLGGVICINLQIFTDSAALLADSVPGLQGMFNQELISTAASQLIAEKECAFESQGYEVVKKALESLDNQPWESLDKASIIDTKNIRPKLLPFHILEDTSLPAHNQIIGVLLDAEFERSHRNLLPLFRQFALLLSSTLQSVIADKYGYYSLTDEFRNTYKNTGFFNTFKVPNDHAVNIKDNLQTCLEVHRYLQTCDAYSRLMADICAASLYSQPGHVPDPEINLVDTGMIIGTKGWKQISTNENYKLLLKNTIIEVRYGKAHVSHTDLSN